MFAIPIPLALDLARKHAGSETDLIAARRPKMTLISRFASCLLATEVLLDIAGGIPRIKVCLPKKMKIALSYICSVICVGFVLCWVLLMQIESGLNKWGGHLSWDQPQGPFTQFWVVMPIILAIIGAVAVWLPLSTSGKTTLLGSLFILCLASSLLDEQTVLGGLRTFKVKVPTMLKGSIPLLFPLLTWTAEFMLSKTHKSSLTQASRETTKDYAIASLILSLTFVIFGPLGSIPGIIYGHIALKRYKSALTQEGRGMAKAGTIIGWVCLTYWVLRKLWFLSYYFPHDSGGSS